MSFKNFVHAIALAALFAAVSNIGTGVFTAGRRAEAAPRGGISVVASFYPLYVHLLNITGGRAGVEVLLPPGASIHDFSCKPSDIKKVAGASLLVVNGAGLDDFALKIAQNYAPTGLKIVNASYGVELIKIVGPESLCTNRAGHDHETINGAPGVSGDLQRPCDPHTWLSPKNAIKQVKNIARALCEIDPANASFYEANAAAYAKKIEALDEFAIKKLAQFKGSKFIVFHGSFAYFARDYGLEQDSIADAFGNAPKPSKIKDIYDTIKRDGIKFLVSEPGYQNNEIKALSEQYELEVIELDPMGSYGCERPADTNYDYFINTMKSNVEKLSAAFEKTPRK